MSQPLVFYDIIVDPTGQDRQSWSPNPWKIRLALNYKKVPYTTVWVQYADIQTAMKDIGASPTGKRPTGEDRYTLPTIRNPNTGEVISDSPKIMAYLEEKYPERPLIPQGTLEQQTSAPVSFIGPDFFALVIGPGLAKMSPQSAAAWERVIRSFDNGPPFAERPRPTAESWQNLRGSFTRFAQQYEGHKYRFGDHITYADLVIAALLLALDGSATKEQRAEFRTWDDGRWAALIEEVQGAGYTATDHGEFYVAQP